MSADDNESSENVTTRSTPPPPESSENDLSRPSTWMALLGLPYLFIFFREKPMFRFIFAKENEIRLVSIPLKTTTKNRYLQLKSRSNPSTLGLITHLLAKND